MAYQPSVDVVKVENLSSTAWEILKRQVALPALIQTINGEQFKHSLGDTVRIRVPGRAKARRRALRPATEADRTIVLDNIVEKSLLIEINENIYSGVPLEDEVLTMDINDALEILRAQVEAVGEDYEQFIGSGIADATYLPSHQLEWNPAKPYDTIVDAAGVLDDCWVPDNGRTLLVGSAVKRSLKKSEQFTIASNSGETIASSRLERGIIGNVDGYNVVESQAIPTNKAYLFHRSAFGAATVTPAVPGGAAFGKQINGNGSGAPAMTWIKDYDAIVSRDRSIVHFYAGFNVFEDQPDNRVVGNAAVAAGGLLRAVELTLDAS
jgi:hypothetical protein